MNDQYIVYVHYLPNSTIPFYIGEGRPKRANQIANRNRYWRHKVKRYGGFESEVVVDNIEDKATAESIEANLIQLLLDDGLDLTNLAIGPPFGNHWSSSDLNYDPTKHPTFGKKFPGGKASIRMAEWNKQRRGELSPVYGKKRPDLSERNKNANSFRHHTKEILCVELNKRFKSITLAKKFAQEKRGLMNINMNRALAKGSIAGGYHWEYTWVTYLD